MGRRKTIDRDEVLDAADALVAEHGAGALTIGMVAEAAGITKGGVQSCFGNKEALITAMLDRWLKDDERRFERFAGKDASPTARLRAHIETARTYDDDAQTRTASLLAALLTPQRISASRDWYEGRLSGFSPDTDDARRMRLAFLASEGIFHLRYLGLLPIDSAEWQDTYDDIVRLMDGKI